MFFLLSNFGHTEFRKYQTGTKQSSGPRCQNTSLLLSEATNLSGELPTLESSTERALFSSDNKWWSTCVSVTLTILVTCIMIALGIG